MNRSGYTTEPFYLGIEGEEWNEKLPGLVIPTGKISPEGKMISIAVVKGHDGYGVVSHNKWEHTEDTLMAASIVRSMLEDIQNNGVA